MLRQLVVGQVLTLVGPRAGHEVSPCAERRGRARLYCRNGASAAKSPARRHISAGRPTTPQLRAAVQVESTSKRTRGLCCKVV